MFAYCWLIYSRKLECILWRISTNSPTADKKSGRLAAEGGIGTYNHDSRICVLLEVDCETDFVGGSDKIKELVNDLVMQVIACPQVQFVFIKIFPKPL